MPDLSRSELVAYAVCAMLVAVLGYRALRAEAPVGAAVQAGGGGARTGPGPGSGPGSGSGSGVPVQVRPAAPADALVHVVGAVRRPGVYRLAAGARVQDAIRRAGGARRGADLQAVNLAAKVADAQQIVVPRRAAAGTAAVAAAPAGAGAAGPAAPVNLNTATAEQLDTLDGVGPATAQKILDYRTQHGGFRAVDDLTDIPGIGPKKLAALRGKVVV